MKCRWNKSGLALVAVLMTMVLCLILVSFALKLVADFKYHQNHEKRKLLARISAESGIAYARARLEANLTPEAALDLEGLEYVFSDNQSFRLNSHMYHGYVHLVSTGFSGEEQHVEEVLLGSRIYELGSAALVVKEAPFEMIASGTTRIQGDVWLPDTAIIPKATRGLPAADRPLMGKLHKMTPEKMPGIKSDLGRRGLQWLEQATKIHTGMGRISTEEDWHLEGATLKFDNRLDLPHSVKTISGKGLILVKGDILIPGELNIGPEVTLVASGDLLAENHLAVHGTLVAHQINIKTAVSGSGIFMGISKVFLPQNTQLVAPCQIVLLQGPTVEKTPGEIRVQGGRIQGLIYTLAREKEWATPTIRIDEGSQIEGYIYTTGRLRMEGRLTGHATTGKIFARSESIDFENWMKNLEIDRAIDQVNWALPIGWGKKTEVLAWLKK